MSNIKTVFKRLGEWAKYPAYQLERRADIFFAMYLPEIIESHFTNESVNFGQIIPEFPIRQDWHTKKGKGDQTRRSNKVDYMVFGAENIYFIELKTTMNSFEPEKDEAYLTKACGRDVKETSFSSLIRDIIEIRETSDEKLKYNDLIAHICSVKGLKGKIKLNPDIMEAGNTKKFKIEEIKDEEIINDKPRKIIYILPCRKEKEEVNYKELKKLFKDFDGDLLYIFSFTDIIKILNQKKGNLAKHFAGFLESQCCDGENCSKCKIG